MLERVIGSKKRKSLWFEGREEFMVEALNLISKDRKKMREEMEVF